MRYAYYMTLFVLMLIGGSIAPVFAAVGGIAMIVYICFELGPTLGLIALPVAICFGLCVWLEDLAWMYALYVVKYVLICLVVTIAVCHYRYEEGYKRIVIGVTACFTAVTVIASALWLYMPRDFKVPSRVDSIQIQQMSESTQAIYTAPEDIEKLLKRLDNMEVLGAFEEMNEHRRTYKTYRLTLLDKNGKEMATYFFYNRYYMAKQVGKHLIYYRMTEDCELPYDQVVAMCEYAHRIDP